MNRQPATKIRPPKFSGSAPIVSMLRLPAHRETYKALFESAREVHGKPLEGITHVTNNRAWFQIKGDTTPYSVAITSTERALFW